MAVAHFCAGTKRPYRFFFAPLRVAGGRLQDHPPGSPGSTCPFVAYKLASLPKFPLEMELFRAAQGTDYAACGLYNQFECAKYILQLGGEPTDWRLKEIESYHRNGRLNLFTGISIVQEHTPGKAKDVPAAGAPCGEAVADDDMSFFDLPMLVAGFAARKKSQPSPVSEDEGADPDWSDFEDGIGSDPELDEMDVAKKVQSELVTVMICCIFVFLVKVFSPNKLFAPSPEFTDL